MYHGTSQSFSGRDLRKDQLTALLSGHPIINRCLEGLVNLLLLACRLILKWELHLILSECIDLLLEPLERSLSYLSLKTAVLIAVAFYPYLTKKKGTRARHAPRFSWSSERDTQLPRIADLVFIPEFSTALSEDPSFLNIVACF